MLSDQILATGGWLSVKPANQEEILWAFTERWTRGEEIVNAIGHSDLDRIVRGYISALCRIHLPLGNRLSIAVEYIDSILVAQYIGPRLEEGATMLPPEAIIKWFWVEYLPWTMLERI